MSNEHDIPITLLRPRFRLVTPRLGQEIADDLNRTLANNSNLCTGEAHAKYALLKIPEEDQHYWSPQLSITIDEDDEEGTVVRGTYGPRPSVWMMFVFFYAVIAFAVLILGIIGLAKISMGESAPFLWIIPVLVVIFFSLYHVAYIGKKKGYVQGELLHRFFEEATGLRY